MSTLTNETTQLKARRKAPTAKGKRPKRGLALTSKERNSYILKLVKLAWSNPKALLGGLIFGGFLTALGFVGQRVWGHYATWGVWDYHMQMAISCCGALILSSVKVWKLAYKAGGSKKWDAVTATGLVLFIEASMICAPVTLWGWVYASCCAAMSFVCNSLAMTETILGEEPSSK